MRGPFDTNNERVKDERLVVQFFFLPLSLIRFQDVVFHEV